MLEIDEIGDGPGLKLDRVEEEDTLKLDEVEDRAKLELETIGDEDMLKLDETEDESKIELDRVEDETELRLENKDETPFKLKEAEANLLELLVAKCRVLVLDKIELKVEIMNEFSRTDEVDVDDVPAIMKELVIDDELGVEDELVQAMELVELNTNEDMVRLSEREELSTVEELADENGTMVFDSNEPDVVAEETSSLDEETLIDEETPRKEETAIGEEVVVFHVDDVATLFVTDGVVECVYPEPDDAKSTDEIGELFPDDPLFATEDE